MSNKYYTPAGNNRAVPGTTVRSQQFNGNNLLVEQAFDRLPDPDALYYSTTNFVVSTGDTPNQYDLSLTGITVLKDGMEVAFRAHKANTGPVVVRVNSLYTRTVRNSLRKPLIAGDILVNTICLLRYDDVNGEFQMSNAVSNVAEEVAKAQMYAQASQNSATNSANSAQSSLDSKNAAALSEANALASKNAAAASDAHAVRVLDDIYSRYIGSFGTLQTQRPNGSPLTGGELMFLSVAPNAGRGLYVYDVIDTTWKPTNDPQVATLLTIVNTRLTQHIGARGDAAHMPATSAQSGFMSAADKAKLDGVQQGATNYQHPTGDGNMHVPATGSDSNGKILMAGATPGSAVWAVPALSNIAGLVAALNAKLDAGANAVSASRWATVRSITLNGDVSGSTVMDGSQGVTLTVTLPNVVTQGWKTKVYTDAKGRVTQSDALAEVDIPSLDKSKIRGLGNSASRDVGTSSGTVMAGDDSRVVNAVKGNIPLGGWTNLNTLGAYAQEGIYYQDRDANALPALGYPLQLSGTLFVTRSAYGCQQEYTSYGSSGSRKFVRGLAGPWNGSGPWSPWREYFGTMRAPTLDEVVDLRAWLNDRYTKGEVNTALDGKLNTSGGQVGALGINTSNALGGNSITLGDNDTGIKQNGDGNLDIYANGDHVTRFRASGVNITRLTIDQGFLQVNGVPYDSTRGLAIGDIPGGRFVDWQSRPAGIVVGCPDSMNSAHSVWKASHWGQFHIAALDVFAPPSGFMARLIVGGPGSPGEFFFRGNGGHLDLTGQVRPGNYGNFDARYASQAWVLQNFVQNMDLTAPVEVQFWDGRDYPRGTDGAAMYNFKMVGGSSNVGRFIIRYTRKQINGTWYNLG